MKVSIEQRYQQQLDALPPFEKVARSTAMFQWAAEQMARHLVSSLGELSPEELRVRVALRLYRNEPAVLRLLERRRQDVLR